MPEKQKSISKILYIADRFQLILNTVKMKTIICVLLLFIGGIIASIGYNGRTGNIKSALSRKAGTGSVRISPLLLSNHYSRSRLPGLLLTYNF